MIAQGEVWWADLPAREGSAPGLRRPIVVVQADSFNQSAIRTVVVVPLTTNLRRADAPGNVRLSARATGLRSESVANVSQIVATDRTFLTERVGKLSRSNLELVLTGIDIVIGR